MMNATFAGRGAGKEVAKPVTQIFTSLKTVALNQGIFFFFFITIAL